MIKSILISVIAITGFSIAPTPVNAGTMNCYGSEYMQSCTYSDWVNGEYVTCYGTVTRYNENWNCY